MVKIDFAIILQLHIVINEQAWSFKLAYKIIHFLTILIFFQISFRIIAAVTS